MSKLVPILAGAVLLGAVANPAAAQRKEDWRNQWYWGAHVAGLRYKTALQPYYWDPMAGAHWLITADRTALYVGFDQAFFTTDAVTVIDDPASSGSSVGPGFRDVSFSSVRRVMFGIVVMPKRGIIEPIFGGGFSMMQVLDPTVDCTGCLPAEAFEAESRAEDASSKAFGWAMAGLQMNFFKLTLFGDFIVQSAAQQFLIEGTTTTFQVGARYSFGSSKEGIAPSN
jgi:hypothetical protein